jgi:hypothetical protein
MRDAGGNRRGVPRRRTLLSVTSGARRLRLPVAAWRWRYEIALAIVIPAAIAALLTVLGLWWALVDATLIAMFLIACPPARAAIIARTWCVITAHRVRTGCAEAFLVSRRGALPVIYSTTPTPYGQRVKLWCPAGIVAADFESAADLVAAACWAREVRVSHDPLRVHLVILDVIRRQESEPAALV